LASIDHKLAHGLLARAGSPIQSGWWVARFKCGADIIEPLGQWGPLEWGSRACGGDE
jgi:hypothetical protein